MIAAVTLAQALGSRERQEDRARAEVIHGCVVAVLADGMGGHACGDEAAQAAVDAVIDLVRSALPGRPQEPHLQPLLLDAVEAACAAVRPLPGRAGCTLDIVLAWPDGRVAWQHVGDAQIWAVSDTLVEPLTRPHGAGRWLSSCIPDVDDNDHATYLGGVTSRIVLATDGVGAPNGRTAAEIVQAQIALGLPHQDNATAIVIDVPALADGITIGPLVTVESAPAEPAQPKPAPTPPGGATHFRWPFEPEAACGATGVALVDQDRATCPACLATIVPF